MADYYRIETSNQAVTGTAAGEMFELVPYTDTLTNVIINAAGGNDTIKVSASSYDTISATIMNLASSSVLDIGSGTYYYTTEADGLAITNSSGRLKLKLWARPIRQSSTTAMQVSPRSTSKALQTTNI